MNKSKAGEMRAMDIDADYFNSYNNKIEFCQDKEVVASFNDEVICGVIKIFITE